MDSIAEAVFLKARDDHDGAVKWTLAALGVVTYLYLAFFRASVGLHAAADEAQRQRARLEEAAAIPAAIAESARRVTGMRSLLARALEEIKADFTELDRLLASSGVTARAQNGGRDGLPRLPAAEGGRIGDVGAMTFQGVPATGPAEGPMMMVQTGRDAPRPVGAAVRRLPAFDERLLATLQAHATRTRGAPTELMAGLRDLLTDYVDAHITRPRLQALNDVWAGEIAKMAATAALVDDRVDAGRALAPELGEAWDRLAADVRAAYAEAKDARFALTGDAWWRSVQSKGSAFDALAAQALGQMEAALGGEGAIGRVDAALARLATAQAAAKTAIDGRAARLVEEFEARQAALASLAGAFEAVRLDLDTFVSYFPAFLGLTLTAALVWAPWRRAGVAAAWSALRAADPAYGRHAGLAACAAAGTAAGRVLSVACGLACLGWVYVAFRQLAAAPSIAGASHVALAVGALGVVAGTAARIVIARRADACARGADP